MRRVAWTLALVPLLAACTTARKAPDEPEEIRLYGLTAWPDVACPPGAVETARMRLEQIKAWATADGKTDAHDKAHHCLTMHTGKSDFHSTRVYAAWLLAKNAYSSSGDVKAWLWVLCTSELTHDNDGGSGG